ncbi:uncharacterized protein L201_004093 [Kwoniella dendrophila CBS 6074]|uniref:Kinesin motor domain-containing protein n=1 Tax=Kwoniella dendrophila CBS 6074 TaxID=1295534 RepID=A0AAX4JXB4_9TREE
MSLSPSKPRTLSRQPSSPSLAVGLPPALPESNIMQPSSPSKMPKSKSRKRIHRGDVSSSAASSDNEEEDTLQTTPKRKIINPIDSPLPPSTGKKTVKKMTLEERLAAAASTSKAGSLAKGGLKAKVKSSRSLAELSSSISEPAAMAESSSSGSTVLMTPQSRSEIIGSRSTASTSSSDKVVVCVRIKPTENPFANIAYEMTPTSLTLSDEHPGVKKRGGKAGREDGYTYTFDKLLQYPSTTPELYQQKIAPLVDKAMNGFNSTIFAYGQTGSGKSFTMTGTSEELGIIPCAVDGVFDAITADTERAFLLRVSYIEIYNETLRDLLNFKKGPLKDDEKPAIHYAKGKVYVDPLSEEIVSTPQDVIDLLEKGNAQRRIGATDWNERSSRSHCVFTIVVESRPRDGDGDDDIRLSRLDLAGSEKAVSDSERRGEGKHINQSLLALREVINKLTEKTKATHVPYRNSKLTHLLENALGGDSNICVICTMSAEEEHCSETLETLKFAGRCSQVKTNAKKNVLQSSERALIKAKDQEIEELKLRLANLTKGETPRKEEPQEDAMSNLAESVAAMEARKAKLAAQLSKLNGEILTSELPRSGSGLPLSPPKPKRRRISDFSAILATGSGRMGIGLGTPKKTVDRRAISGMSRLTEESEGMAGIMNTLDQAADGSVAKSFEQDRALAAARRNLAAKEEELALANRNLASALGRASQLSERDARIISLEAELREALDALASTQETKQHTEQELAATRQNLQYIENDMIDRTAQLENTRNDLVATIDERAKKIDELENKIIDLRNSREELIIEDQGRLDEILRQVADVKQEKEALLSELDGFKTQLDSAERTKQEELEKIKSEMEVLVKQRSDTQVALEAATTQNTAYESTLSDLRGQIDSLSSAQASRQAEVANLQTEKSLLERQTEEARSNLDRFQREVMSNEATVLKELREEIGNLRRGRDEDKAAWEKTKIELEEANQVFRKQQGESQAEAVNVQNVIVEAEEREKKLQNQLAEALRTLEEAAKANANLEVRLRQETESKVSLENEKVELLSQLTISDQQVNAVQQINRNLEDRFQSESTLKITAEKERDEARSMMSEAGGIKEQLQLEIGARHEAETKLIDITKQLDSQCILVTNLQAQLSILQDVQDKLSAAQTDLETQEKRLEIECAARQDAENRCVEMAKLRDQAVAVEKEREIMVEKESSAKRELEDQVENLSRQREANLEGVKEIRRKLDIEVIEKKELEQQLDQLKARQEAASSGEGEIKEALAKEILAKEEISRQLVKVTEDFQMSVETLKVELSASQKATREAEQRLSSLSAHTQSISDIQNQLTIEIAARNAAESHISEISRELVNKHESAQQILEEELLSVRETLKAAQSEASEARMQIEDQRNKLSRLSAELSDIKSRSEVTITTSISSRLRHSAPGPGHGIDKDMSSTALDSLRLRSRRGVSSGTGTLERDHSLDMLRAREEEEIERLEKIIEVQKGIIDEQREKIERWAKEMEKQREIVRLLTNDNSASVPSPSPVPIRTGSPRGHAKSHSISHSPMPSPLPNAKGLVSTFTARNLALPTSPSPLPMHPSQFNNSSSRKNRRVTIEHDIDRLAETSKVNKAKAIFESPEKNAVPATPPKAPLRAAQSIRSVPRQRRP